MKDAIWDEKLGSHIRELRWRLMAYALSLLVGAALCYLQAAEIYRFLLRPLGALMDGDRRLIFTSLPEAFITHLKIAFYGGFYLSFPVLAFHIYRFAAPGLYAHERRVMLPVLVAAPLLFALGAGVAYYGIFPAAWAFFLSFEQQAIAGIPAIQLEARVAEYLSLSMQIMLGFGIAFQMPLVLLVMVRMGVISARWLATQRRIAILVIFIAAAFLTPPDVMSQIGLAVPLVVLYEITILLARWLEPAQDEKNLLMIESPNHHA